MQRHNLDLTIEEDFFLIAIHGNLEEYKLAFLINKYLNLGLKRKQKDLDFFNKNVSITYPVYEYTDLKKEDIFYLISNVCKTVSEKTISAGSLFESESEEKTHYLVPEYKQSDFLLKIVSEEPQNYEKEFLSELSKLPGILTAYAIDQNKLKSKQNLNFD
jgi:hypothetical protein